MSSGGVRFDGTGAGLGKRQGGNANDFTDYTMICGQGDCGIELGPVAAFKADSDGLRAVSCPQCLNVSIVDKNGQLLKVIPVARYLELKKQHDARKTG